MEDFDVVVVGGGAAGLSAALVLGRALRRVAVVDAGHQRNAPAGHMYGYLTRDGTPPVSLLQAGAAEVAAYGGQLVEDFVEAIDPGFLVRLASGRRLNARRVLVATGLHDELPDIDGLRARWGRDVLHCPYCHGYEVRDQPLGVLGGSPEAEPHALLVRQWSADVAYFPHTDTLTGVQRDQLTSRGVTIVEGRVARLVVAEHGLRGVELADGTVVDRAAVFVRPRFVPNDRLLTALGCAKDEGWVVVDDTGHTSVHGVWAAGNVVDPRAQVITAAGAGSSAATAINADLVAEDVQHAIADLHGRPTEPSPAP